MSLADGRGGGRDVASLPRVRVAIQRLGTWPFVAFPGSDANTKRSKPVQSNHPTKPTPFLGRHNDYKQRQVKWALMLFQHISDKSEKRVKPVFM